MALNTIFKINGVDWTGSILTPFSIEKNKLWGEDTGRTMSGKLIGTLVGIFPKVKVKAQFNDETLQAQFLTALDSAFQNIEFYDPKTMMMKSSGTYTSDYSIEIINLDPFFGEITVSFIATEKE